MTINGTHNVGDPGHTVDHNAIDDTLLALPSTYVTMTLTTAGHPTTGTWPTGQSVIDSNGATWNCTAGGTPGTWVAAGGGGSGGTPAVVLGTAAAAGVSTHFLRDDDTIVAFDATSPSTQAFGDSAVVGTATVAARRDHKHAMPATTKDTTAITGVLKGNGSAVSAAVAADIPTAAIGATGAMAAATTLDAITAPAGNVSANSHKITNLTNGSSAQDGAAFGQIPLLSSTLPSPNVIGAVIGSGTTTAKADHQHTRGYWAAIDYGFAAMSVPPDMCQLAGLAMTAGTIYGSVLILDAITTITSLYLAVGTSGSTLTASQCGVALYDPSKTLIGSTFQDSGATDLHTSLASTGTKTTTLTATGTGLTSLAPGKYYAVIFQNGTTPAVLRCASNTTIGNGILSAANSKYFSADTGRTTTFPTTLGAFTAFSGAHFFAIS